MVDLRSEMEDFMDKYADWGLLLQTDSTRACSCVESLSNSANPNCKRCLGSGKIAVAKKVRIRSKMTSSQDTLPKNLVSKAVGDVAVGVREFYLEYTNRVKQNDYILFCEWNGNIPILNQYTSLYRILNADPLRGDAGRLEYIKVTSDSDPVNFRTKFNGIVNNINGYEYYLAIQEVE